MYVWRKEREGIQRACERVVKFDLADLMAERAVQRRRANPFRGRGCGLICRWPTSERRGIRVSNVLCTCRVSISLFFCEMRDRPWVGDRRITELGESGDEGVSAKL